MKSVNIIKNSHAEYLSAFDEWAADASGYLIGEQTMPLNARTTVIQRILENNSFVVSANVREAILHRRRLSIP